MNKLFPNKEQMQPITNRHDAFYDGPFKKQFDELSTIEKLQIINDIVRQSMVYSDCPNPYDDKETLIGDSYTSCIVSIEYIKQLAIDLEIKKVFACVNPCENEKNAIPVPILLIKDENNIYIYDATPRIGYKAGKVEKISDQYQYYIDICGEIEETYELLRTIKYHINNDLYNETELKKMMDFCQSVNKSLVLDSIINEIKLLKSNKNNVKYDIIVIVNRINRWKDELFELQKADSNYQRQIELAQLITLYSNIINKKSSALILLDDGYYELSKLTPRILYEKGLEYITIKPSAYIIEEEDVIERAFPKNQYGVNYNEFGTKTSLGLEPMKLFHPDGHKYIREMTGPTKSFLVKKTIEDTLETKRKLRKQIIGRVKVDNIIWFDNMPINWNPVCLNFIHSSDNSVDACMGYTATVPEYQIMTRFNYPNPILMKEKKYERI